MDIEYKAEVYGAISELIEVKKKYRMNKAGFLAYLSDRGLNISGVTLWHWVKGNKMPSNSNLKTLQRFLELERMRMRDGYNPNE